MEFHEQFKSKRRSFRLLIAALAILLFIHYFTKPVEESLAGVGNVLFIGGLVMIALYSWLVFRCPNCRSSASDLRAAVAQRMQMPGMRGEIDDLTGAPHFAAAGLPFISTTTTLKALSPTFSGRSLDAASH